MLWRDHIVLTALYPLDVIRRRAYQLISCFFLVFVILGGFAFHAANAQEETGDKALVLNEGFHLENQLFNHPVLRQSAARACRAIFVLGQRKAEKRLDVSASISGERQIASNFRTNNNDPLPSSLRGYNHSYDDIYDMELTARYRLYDWGVGAARVRSEESRLQAERLNYEASLVAVVEDILRIMIQIEAAQDDIVHRTKALDELAPHVRAIEAQGEAGPIGLAQVREAKLSVLNAEIALQRAERRKAEVDGELQSRFKVTYEDTLPLLHDFLRKRPEDITVIDSQDWLNVRVIDARIIGEREDLVAIENERYPRVDSVLESTIFDVTDFESEYQLVGRLEFTLPLYDGGSNEARQQQKSWQVKELISQRDEQLRNHKTNTEQGKIILEKRKAEIITLQEQYKDIDERYQSLNALVGNSLVSRQQIIQLLQERTEKTIELSQAKWQQEYGLLRLHALANSLTNLLAITPGENQC